MKVEFFRHSITEVDIAQVTDVLRATFLTAGPVTARFEKRFSEYTGLDHTIGLNSCTAALHLSLLALGVGPGDEVITTPMTFIATATAIMHTGARPVFVDIEKETGLMDVSKIEPALTPRTKAVIPVHLYGSMVDMKTLRDIADRHGLKIVEDAAHCIEASRDGIRPGQLSDAACYSFYATKNITCGEGGAVATRNGALAERIRRLRQHGMSREAADRYAGNYRHWDMVDIGWKYNMHDISAALLIDQLRRIQAYLKKRESIWKRYDAAFNRIPGIRIPQTRGKSACHMYTIWVDPKKRDRILHHLQERGVGVAVNYRAVHTLTYFKKTFGFKPSDFPIAWEIGRKTITLPLYPGLGIKEAAYVIETVSSVLAPYSETA
jgi:dTDP-4-amino-4,6-dideoxygalactose transaminase